MGFRCFGHQYVGEAYSVAVQPVRRTSARGSRDEEPSKLKPKVRAANDVVNFSERFDRLEADLIDVSMSL